MASNFVIIVKNKNDAENEQGSNGAPNFQGSFPESHPNCQRDQNWKREQQPFVHPRIRKDYKPESRSQAHAYSARRTMRG
jgi:hypothetical protein